MHESNKKKIQEPKLIFLESACLGDQKYMKMKIFHRGLLKKSPKIDFYVVKIRVKGVLFGQNIVKIKIFSCSKASISIIQVNCNFLGPAICKRC